MGFGIIYNLRKKCNSEGDLNCLLNKEEDRKG